MHKNVCSIFLVITLLIPLIIPSSFSVSDYPSFVNSQNSWRNTPSSGELSFRESAVVRPILVNGMFVCGFHCTDNCLFAVSIFKTSSDLHYLFPPTVVWSANTNNPIPDEEEAVLELTSQGNLILKHANGTLVWSPNAAGSRLNLSAEGNLMLLNQTNHMVWQSFDHPTDSLVPGQKASGQKLRASVSSNDPSGVSFAFAIIGGEFRAYIDSDPSQIYCRNIFMEEENNSSQSYAEFLNQSFGTFFVGDSSSFIQLGNDGHLKAYTLTESGWEGTDLLSLDRSIYNQGNCSFLSQIFSIKKSVHGGDAFSAAFIKVHNSPEKKRQDLGVIVASTLGAIIAVFLICGLFFLRAQQGLEQVEEYALDDLFGIPTRFSYEELKNVTKNFSIKLGPGGFGSVFHGILPSGSEVAMKHLVGFGSVNKSFIAEVQTIGSINHFNLVSLVGYCAENFSRLLVYDYMVNGSLDRRIFNKKQDLALEILCGRRNIDGSQQEEDRHLLGLFRRKQEERELIDLVDKCSDDMKLNAAEVVEMMKVAAWCLQAEYAKRLSMSTVVKLLEGSVDVADKPNEEFLNGLPTEAIESLASMVLPSMLSGPSDFFSCWFLVKIIVISQQSLDHGIDSVSTQSSKFITKIGKQETLLQQDFPGQEVSTMQADTAGQVLTALPNLETLILIEMPKLRSLSTVRLAYKALPLPLVLYQFRASSLIDTYTYLLICNDRTRMSCSHHRM
ncbi:hypothetical protein V6N13_096861 [Hibiscus sabdariffa]